MKEATQLYVRSFGKIAYLQFLHDPPMLKYALNKLAATGGIIQGES